MKRYDTYKPSGSRLIGDIPGHWELRRIRYLVKDNGESIKIGPFGSSLTGKVISDGDYKVYGQWNIIGKDFSAGLNTVTEETYNNLINYQIVEDDILISMMGTVGKCATIPRGIQKGIMDSHVIKIRLNQSIMKSDFFEYVYDKDNSNVVFPQIQEIKKGSIMDGLNSSLLKDFMIPVPPLAEQEAIAAYLDARCADIDKVVATQQKRIALLQELKQSEITQAVTRGLNPDARMKDSGVEWIGMVPEHWEVKKLKHVSTAILKGNGITKEQVFEDGDTPCVRYGELYTKYNHSFTECVSATNKDALTVLQYFDHGDILFTCTGELVEEIGKSIVYLGNERCLAGGDILILKHTQNPAFLNYASNSYGQIQKSCGRAKLKVVHISTYDISSLLIALPSMTEQEEIVEYLDRRCGEIDKQIGAVTRQIELLREYKQALITEVVTGKRRV